MAHISVVGEVCHRTCWLVRNGVRDPSIMLTVVVFIVKMHLNVKVRKLE